VIVDVDISPVKTPEGPTMIGIMTTKVLPLLSVVVCVKVDASVAVRPWPLLDLVLISGLLLLIAAAGRRVDCAGSVANAAA
jgi:hypothetical protein